LTPHNLASRRAHPQILLHQLIPDHQSAVCEFCDSIFAGRDCRRHLGF
jgi:hypothetical protein